MGLAANALCTVSQCKWKTSVSATTAEVENKINAASDWIANYVDRHLIQDSYEEKIELCNSQNIILKEYPVTSISTLIIDDETIDSADYRLSESRIIIKEDGVFRGELATVNYTAGYISPTTSSTTLPYDVQEACVLMSRFMYYQDSAQYQQAFSNTEDGQDIAFPVVVYRMLNRYKRLL